MNILFTSDLHGEELAFDQFRRLLGQPEYDMGVISGDLQEEYIIRQEVIDLLGLGADDLLEELQSDDPPDKIDLWNSANAKHVKAALELKAQPLRERLLSTGKPVLIVRGNHDKIPWNSEGPLMNISQSFCDLFGYRFVGYEHTEMTRSHDDQMADIHGLQRIMNNKTILVTHGPSYGVLDGMGIEDTQKGRMTAHIGSKALQYLKKNHPPKLHLFGHIHSSFGIQGSAVNGSYSPILRKMIRIERQTKGFLIRSVA
jgi:Icc-related predicted phosphoesterase